MPDQGAGDRFPHLNLIYRDQKPARFQRPNFDHTRSNQNKADRVGHATRLRGQFDALKETTRAYRRGREEAGLPPIRSGIPFAVEVSDSTDLDALARVLKFEVVSEDLIETDEQKHRYVLVAMEDAESAEVLDLLEAFSAGAHGSGVVAGLFDVVSDPEDPRRIESILTPELLARWPFPATEIFTLDISFQTKGVLADLGEKPRKNRRESPEAHKARLGVWFNEQRDRVYRDWDEFTLQLQKEVTEIIRAHGGEICDMVDTGVQVEPDIVSFPDSITMRVTMKGEGFRDLIRNHPRVFEVVEPDMLESPYVTAVHDVEAWPEFEGLPPEGNAPWVGVIDSGIQEGHRYLRHAIRTEKSLCVIPGREKDDVMDEVRGGGHGTRVAGAVLFPGDEAPEGRKQAGCWLANFRVLDENNGLSDRIFPPGMLEKAVEHLPEVKVFVHSINADAPCRLRHMSAWSAKIDDISHRMDVLFVVSAGNLKDRQGPPGKGILDHFDSGLAYPDYLLEPSARIAQPAQSLQALTVGSVAKADFDDGDWKSVAGQGKPSAFTRCGPGIWDTPKPDVVEVGGDVCRMADDQSPTLTVKPEVAPFLIRSTLDGGPFCSRFDPATADEDRTGSESPKRRHNMKTSLSQSQKAIVEAPDQHYLVVASAGSGKTRILTERIRFLLEERKTTARILALTFTNKAAEEMKARLKGIPDLSDRTFIGTIHGFCQGLIDSHGKAIGLDTTPSILDREVDRLEMLEKALQENPVLIKYLEKHDSDSEKRKFLYRVLNKFSECKRDWTKYVAIQSDDWKNEAEMLAFRVYHEYMQSQGVIDYDDILLLAYRILTERPAVANLYHRTYRYLCVDEAQDLNPVQYSLVKVLGAKAHALLMVGDPNQAIYGFNGSSKDFMTKHFKQDFQPHEVVLRENYRSSRKVIRAANALFPGGLEEQAAALVGELGIKACGTEAEEAQWISDKIMSLISTGTHPDIEGPLTLDRIAVLARNRYVFQPLMDTLKQAEIGHYFKQPHGSAELESDAGKLFDLGIRICINPQNQIHLQKLSKLLKLNTVATQSSTQALEILEQQCGLTEEPTRPLALLLLDCWKQIHENVNHFTRVLDRFKGFIESTLPTDGKTDNHDIALTLNDIEFMREVWGNYSRMVPSSNRSLTQFRNKMSTGEILPSVSGKGITLATVHAIKGMEFDVVFIMGLNEGVFPDYRAVQTGGPALEEEKNDAFVAITRAKRFLYLTWPQAKFMPWDKENRKRQSPSRFLKTVEQNAYADATTAEIQHVAEGHATDYPDRQHP